MDAIHRATTKTKAGESKPTNVWQVSLRRHGTRLSRTFAEARWGGREPALAAAQAWRDAVMEAIPPITNHHAATRLPARNTTGIAGVSCTTPKDALNGTIWTATLTTREGQKKRAFSVQAYGEEGARARAIKQRQDWLNELPPRYHSMCETSRTALARHPAPLPAQSLDPLPTLTPDEIKARLATINARFDAQMPKRLRWRVRAQNAAKPDGPLVVALSDACFPARRHSQTITPKGRPLSEMLTDAVKSLHRHATVLHGKNAADWFITTQITPALTAEQFDPVAGVDGCVMVPQAIVAIP